MIIDVKHCVRCGGEHKALEFRPLSRPSEGWSLWAPCPGNGEPVMVRLSGGDQGRPAGLPLPATDPVPPAGGPAVPLSPVRPAVRRPSQERVSAEIVAGDSTPLPPGLAPVAELQFAAAQVPEIPEAELDATLFPEGGR